ncbi:hypothetical protein [Xanthomonas campestris]|uniref:hypothetical protein n=1 Tax=Xanthomonas campestris TaxID=339 RepID=UPI0038901533
MKAPAGTSVALLIVVDGSDSASRSAQAADADAVVSKAPIAASVRNNTRNPFNRNIEHFLWLKSRGHRL